MNHIHHRHCPICNSSQLRTQFQGVDYSHSREEFEVMVCADCSFVFTQNAPDVEHIAKYYQSEDYVSHSDTQKGLFFKVYHWVRSFMLGKKRRLVEKYSHKGTILDLGCGTGYFLNEMKDNGWDTIGIEQDPGARQIGLEKFGLPIHDVNHLFALDSASFDAITLWHVLEHVHDLKGYIKQLSSILKFNGTLVVAVPNHESYDAKHYGQHWAAWDLPIHLWHFSPKTMRDLFKQNGFSIQKIYSLPFDSFYVSMLSEKYKKGSALKGIYIGFISYLRSLVKTEKASSVVYILKKDQ